MSVLLVASTGGHLRELVRLRPRFDFREPVVWVTFHGRQSEALLSGEQIEFAAETAPRDYRNVARNAVLARRLLREHEVTRVVSTGAGVALSFLPLARALGIEAHYIESAARIDGPSLTGRLLSAVPGVRLYVQHAGWPSPRWRYAGSVFDGFASAGANGGSVSPARVVVTLGTLQFGFERLVRRLSRILPKDADVLWQTGSTPVNGLPGARQTLRPDELRAAFSEADVVVTHAGVGSTLDALEAGRCPIVVPRLRRFGEHVDDHQTQMASELAGRGLAIARDADEISFGDLEKAAARGVRAAAPPPFDLR